MYGQAIYKLLQWTFQMLPLLDNNEETVEVCVGKKKKKIQRKEDIKLAAFQDTWTCLYMLGHDSALQFLSLKVLKL